jgi:hypothetical protein
MYVSRGDFTPDPIAAKRNRGPEPAQSIPAARKVEQDYSVLQQPAEVHTPAERQKVRLIQRALSRAQSTLAGLEEFRSMLWRSAAASVQRSALEVLERTRYQGEAVLEPHRQMLLRAAASRDTRELDRLIGIVQQNISALPGGRDQDRDYSASRDIPALIEGIRTNGQALERLERDNVSRLLS